MKNAFTYPQPPGEEDLVRTPRCIDRNVLTGCETEPNSQFPFLAVELESEALVDAVTVYLDHSLPPCIDFGCYQKIKVTKNHLWGWMLHRGVIIVLGWMGWISGQE